MEPGLEPVPVPAPKCIFVPVLVPVAVLECVLVLDSESGSVFLPKSEVALAWGYKPHLI